MKAIIMAGGYGSRLKPLTNNMPKPMMPIINKPIISYIVNLLRKYGVKDIGITLGYKPEHIVNFFGNGENYGVNLEYFIEDTPSGTAGSVKNCKNFLDDTFIVISGDAFTNINIADMVNFHYTHNGLVTMAVKYMEDITGFGVVNVGRNGAITEFIEKPESSDYHLVNTGIYIIERSVLELIPDGKYDFSRELFPRILDKMVAYETEEYWSDIGTLSSYYLTNNDVAMQPGRFGIVLN